MAEGEYSKPIETKTWEIRREIKRQGSPYTDQSILYRVWPVGDGDWKIHAIYSNPDLVSEAMLLPKELLDVIVRESLKGDLRS